MDFETLDDAVLHFWQECQRSPRSFHGCFVAPFADYPDRRYHPCARVPGSRAEQGQPETELPREVVDWLGYERILRERRGEIGIDKYGFDPNSIGGRREEAIEIHLGPEERFGPEIRFPPMTVANVVGVRLYHAYVVHDGAGVFHMSSNPVPLSIVR